MLVSLKCIMHSEKIDVCALAPKLRITITDNTNELIMINKISLHNKTTNFNQEIDE